MNEVKLYTQDEAEKKVAELKSGDDSGWTYISMIDHYTGLHYVQAWDENCYLAGTF